MATCLKVSGGCLKVSGGCLQVTGGGLPPNCQTCSDCTFDIANARMRGNIYFLVKEYSGAGCTGSVLNTWLIQATFDIQFYDACGTGGFFRGWFSDGRTPNNNPDGSTAITVTVYQYNGADVTLPTPGTPPTSVQLEIEVDYFGGGVWQFTPVFTIVGTIAVRPDTTTDQYSGDCTGIASTPKTYCHPTSTTFHVDAVLDMTVANNTGCP